MLNFNFSEKGLGLVYPTHFVHDFSKKLYFFKLPIRNQNDTIINGIIKSIINGRRIEKKPCEGVCKAQKLEN